MSAKSKQNFQKSKSMENIRNKEKNQPPCGKK